MDLNGKIIAVLPEQTFAGRNGEVVRNSFVIETNGQYPKKVKFDVLGSEKWAKMSPFVCLGSDAQVFFDVESREWQGKWFTTLNAYRVTNLGGVQQQTTTKQVTPHGATQHVDDGFPF